MKKSITLVLATTALFAASAASAQAPAMYPVNVSGQSGAPYTTIKAQITVEKESVRTGPYARYAQKYLGAMAPLADRDTYTIKSARMDYADPGRKIAERPMQATAGCGRPMVVSHVAGGAEFSLATPDRTSSLEKSTETMAREAAETIFTLRKRRFDLVTGEAGENVYGEGMKAALEEMARIENEYLALFLGKRTVTTMVEEIEVIPDAGRTNYIVCRFTSDAGIVPQSDLSGQPVVLSITPEMSVSAAAPSRNDKRQMQTYRVADFCECRLDFQSTELTRRRIPVLQFGENVSAPAE